MVISTARAHKHTRAFVIPVRSPGGFATGFSLGIEYCKQLKPKYIANVDGDDIVEPWFIADAVALAEQTRVQIVITDYEIVSTNLKVRFKKSLTEKRACLHAPMPNIRLNLSQHISWYAYTLPAPWRKLILASHAYRFENQCILDGDHLYEDNFMHWCLGVNTRTFSRLDRVAFHHRTSRTIHSTPPIARGGFLHNFERLVIAPWLSNVWRRYLVRYIQSYRWIAIEQPTIKWQEKTLRILDKLTQRASPSSASVAPMDVKSRYDLSIVTPCHLNKVSSIRIFRSIANIMTTYRRGSIEAIIVTGIFADAVVANACEQGAGVLEYEFDDVYSVAVPGEAAGRMRNYASPFVEGIYVLFADADDVIISLELQSILTFAIQHGADIVIFPYTICNTSTDNMCTGMFPRDDNIYRRALNPDDDTNIKMLSLALINYPWNRLVRTKHMHAYSVFFGTTVVHNDINYHWGTIVTSQSVVFAPTSKAVIQHWMYSSTQITHLTSDLRMQNHIAIAFTHRFLLKHVPRFCESPITWAWSKNVRNILNWGFSRVPAQYKGLYKQSSRKMTRCIQKCTTSCFKLHVYQQGDRASLR